MTCTPYNPAIGLFYNTLTWGMTSQNPWSVTLITANGTNDPHDTVVIQKNGAEAARLTIRNPQTTRWIFFPKDFLAVRDVVTSGGIDNYRVWLFDLRGSSVTSQEVPGPWDVPTMKQLHLHPSSDGKAFFLFMADTLPNATRQHIVFRSDTLDQLCAWGPLTTASPAQRLVRINADRTVQIGTSPAPNGFDAVQTCPLPSGKCKTTPCTFPPVIWDGPEAKTSTTSAKLENKGTDCLQVDNISEILSDPSMVPHFKMSNPGTIFIAKGLSANVNLAFAPTGIGHFEADMHVALTAADPASDQTIHCQGDARKSLALCKLSLQQSPPEVVFGVNNTSSGSFTVKNEGGDKLKLQAVTDSAHFHVVAPQPDYSTLLGAGGLSTVHVEFRPDATGSFSENLQVSCIPANGDKAMHLSASARLPQLGIGASQPEPFTTFCYRKKKLIVTLSNTGEVPLEVAVTGSSANFSVTPIAPIPANSSSPLEIFVWSGSPGDFSVTLTITGSFHLVVKDKVDHHTILDQVLTTSCTLPVTGTVVPMPPDSLEPNDDFVEAAQTDLPAPGFVNPAKLGYSGLTLHDCAGNDKDYFALSFTPSAHGEVCTTTVTSHTLGLKMFTYPTTLTVSTKTTPALRDDGQPFTRTLQIYKSDTYNRQLVAETAGEYSVTCPSATFGDHKLYAVLSNPGFASQGPLEYDISFEYQPSTSVLRGGAFNSAAFVKLKKYYEAIWKVDPPHDKYGKVVSVDEWCDGAPVVIGDMKAFIRKHLAYITRTEGRGTTSKAAKAMLAAEYASLAQTVRAAGLAREAEELYEKGAAEFSKAGLKEKQAGALRGLLGLYRQTGLAGKAAGVEKALAKIATKARVSK